MICIGTLSAAFLVGCGSNRTPVTSAEEFEKIVEGYGLTVSDEAGNIAEVMDRRSLSMPMFDYEASNEDLTLQLAFYEFETDDDALAHYNHMQSYYREIHGENATSTNSKISSSLCKYSLTANGTFHSVAVAGRFVLSVCADSNQKAEAKNIIKDLGY